MRSMVCVMDREPLRVMLRALLLTVALLAISTVLWPRTAAAQAPEVFDRLVVAGEKNLVKGKDHRGRQFLPKFDGRPVWVVMHLLIEAPEGNDGESAWNMALEGIPMQLTDTVALFRSRFMSRVPRLDVNASPAEIRQVIEPLFGAEEAERIAADPSVLKRLRRAVVTKLISLDKVAPGNETWVSFSLLRVEDVRPLAMTVVVGQGDLPPDVRAWVDEAQGSWFKRYRPFVALVMLALVGGGYVWWRLLRRN